MSTWTHVAATIRFDALRLPGMPDQKPDLGKTCSYDDNADVWDACTVPKGSEGSLGVFLLENPDASCASSYTAVIYGDLRDYDDADEIIDYLKRVTDGRFVRQGIATIEVGGAAPVIAKYEKGKWVKSFSVTGAE